MRTIRATIVVAVVVTGMLGGAAAARAVTLPVEDVEVDVSAAPVSAGTFAGGQTVHAVRPPPPEGSPEDDQAATAPHIQCMLSNRGFTVVDRASGPVKATFTFGAGSSCSAPMVELGAQATLKHNGGSKSATPDATCNACLQADTGRIRTRALRPAVAYGESRAPIRSVFPSASSFWIGTPTAARETPSG